MSRIRQLDALRGFALVGIVLGNVQWFSGYAVEPSPAKDVWGLDAATTFGLHLLVDGKFYALFSLLFGASFALLLQRARTRGLDPASLARRRLTALFLVGLVHATLVWFGDILSLYAVAALPLYVLLRRSNTAVLRWSLALLATPALLGAAMLLTGAAGQPHALLYGPMDQLPAFASGDGPEVMLANAAFLEQRWVLALASGRLPRLLGLFLLGALWVRTRPTPTARTLCGLWVCAALSNLALALMSDVPTLPPSGLGVARDALACLALPTGALSYATALWHPLGRAGPVSDALASAGRLSLTHYLTQSLVLVALFYGLGCGGWGQLGAAASVVVAGALVSVQVATSGPLLRRWQTGPAERLLRRLDGCR